MWSKLPFVKGVRAKCSASALSCVRRGAKRNTFYSSNFFSSVTALSGTKNQYGGRALINSNTGALSNVGALSINNAKVLSSTSALRRANVSVRHPLYDLKCLSEGIYLIRERFFVSWNAANIFFVRGLDGDLLVDSGKKYKGINLSTY